MWLPDEIFKSVIQHTPLISIDLIVRNEKGEVLLGKRVNAPAKGYWFVPGGRVRKNETLDDAFVRLVREELGIESGITRADAKFLGVFEHYYEDCVFGDGTSTYYVVLAHEILLENIIDIEYMNNQHNDFEWMEIPDIIKDSSIHNFTKAYFSRGW
ncbi:GDP-mannose mannosyl hydrolase [Acinetobacter schindleri]|nr:GDP-mannose mannosyl hydrolase [Acinetobacter schindleri]